MAATSLKNLNLNGKSVFLRLDLNVPLHGGRVFDDCRIKAAIPTIKYILKYTHKLCIASHLGRPNGKINNKLSLKSVALILTDLLKKEILLVEDYDREPIDQLLLQIGKDQIILLENLRFHKEELDNDKPFAQKLMKGIDIYVNDAFGCVHRAHASIIESAKVVAQKNRAIGFLIEKEIDALKNLQNPQQPFAVLLGGSKISDKIGVILNLLNVCTDIIIGGAMAYTFLKYKNVNIGLSKTEDSKLELIKRIYQNAATRNVKIHLPIDHICAKTFSAESEPIQIDRQEIPKDLIGMDIGPKTQKKFEIILKSANTILWNGPMGVFEWPSFSKGSVKIAEALNEAKGYSVVGGGDSLAVIKKASLEKKFSHISTGGGATLAMLAGKRLPGLSILE